MAKDRKDRDPEVQLKALGHELRRKIMGVMIGQGGGSPMSPRGVSVVLRQPLSNVSYHVRVLAECEAITLVSTRPARGSMQHFYRPSPKFLGLPWVAGVLGLDPAVGAA
jgi:DNA-binding transcriptional ArsR family regulator